MTLQIYDQYGRLKTFNTNGLPQPIGEAGSTLISNGSSLEYKPESYGVLIPNASIGTNVSYSYTGATWANALSASHWKKDSRWKNADIYDSGGGRYVQITIAGFYIFQFCAIVSFPSSTEVGYGLSSKEEIDNGTPVVWSHNHEKPYNSTSDYKVRTFMRYFPVGYRVCPVLYFSGSTGTLTFNNQSYSISSFSFFRIGG